MYSIGSNRGVRHNPQYFNALIFMHYNIIKLLLLFNVHSIIIIIIIVIIAVDSVS